MHDIDRTQREFEMEHELEHGHEHEAELEQEHEHEAEHEGEAFVGSLLGEAEHEHEHEHEAELEMEAEHEAESPLSEAQEMELASELLEVSNEAELEYFFGKLVRSAARGIKGFVRSPTGKMLGGMLKGVAKKALPIAGAALGGYVGGPIGAKLGGKLGSMATNLFELELEGLSHEDREFEIARQVVRLGAASVRRAARAPRTAPPAVVARKAFTAAARTYAPGLVRGRRGCRVCAARRARGQQGRRPGRGGGASTYVRQANGGTGIIAGSAGYPEPGIEADPGDIDSTDYPVATRGGRWYRRGRHIVLAGV